MDVVSPRKLAVQVKAEILDRSVLRNRLLDHADGEAASVACVIHLHHISLHSILILSSIFSDDYGLIDNLLFNLVGVTVAWNFLRSPYSTSTRNTFLSNKREFLPNCTASYFKRHKINPSVRA